MWCNRAWCASGFGFALALTGCGESQSHTATNAADGGTSNVSGMGPGGAQSTAGTAGGGGRGGTGAGTGGTSASAGNAGTGGVPRSCSACAAEAVCTDGFCADEVHYIMTLGRDDEYLYGVRTDGTYRAPLATGVFEEIPISTGFGASDVPLLVDSTSLYFAGGTGVIAVPKTGGDWTQIATLEDTYGGRGAATDGQHIYWAVDSDTVAGIYRVPTSGGVPEYWIRNLCAEDLAVDDGIVMWACYRNGNGVGISYRAIADGPTLDFSYSVIDGVLLWNRFAVDATHVYWDDKDGGVNSSPRAGGDPVVLDAAPGEIGTLAIDETNVYFCRDNVLSFVPKTGGPATTMVRFEEYCGLYGSIPSTGSMVVGGGAVYVDADNGLYRVPVR
jgi:hypothetical protein